MKSVFLKYPILPPLLGYMAGISISESFGYGWGFILISAPILGLVSLFFGYLRFLLFVPVGVLFSTSLPPAGDHVANLVGVETDLRGTLYRSPESRIAGSRLFLEVDEIVVKGKKRPASGKVVINTKQRVWGLSRGDNVRVFDTVLRSYRTFKNPSGFDIKSYYGRENIHVYGFVSGMDSIVLFEPRQSLFDLIRPIDRARHRFGHFIRDRFPQSEGEILNAITVGDRGAVPNRIRDLFSEAGIAHILAISGLHVGAVALVLFFTIKWALKRSEYFLIALQVPRVAAGLTIVPLFIYTAVAGFAAPVVRAFLMIAVYLISVVMGKEENKLNTLAAAAFAILLWQPWALYQLSFQLSFAAVLGILFINRFYPLSLDGVYSKAISSAKVTLGASFATLPLVVDSFRILSLISLPANLVFLPLVEFLIVPLGLISFFLFSIGPNLASPFLTLEFYLIKFLVSGVARLVEIPFSSLTVTSLGITGWLLYSLIILFICLKNVFPHLRHALPFLVAGFILSMTIGGASSSESGRLNLDFLDISNRTLAFARLPEGKTILVDGGYSRFNMGGYLERSVISRFLLDNDVKTIDYLVLTTLDNDHLEGLKYLLRRFEVKRLWTNGGKLDGEVWKLIKRRKVRWKNIMDEVENFETDGVRIEFYKPRGNHEVADSSRPYPLILKLTLGNVNFLLGESLEYPSVQSELIDTYSNRIQSNVVYVSQLGGNLRVLRDFLITSSPDILIVNDSFDSFQRVFGKGGPVFENHKRSKLIETKREGMVSISTDGVDLRVRTFNDGEVL